MTNYWLDRKKSREYRLIAGLEFIDLSGVSSAGGRYKEYERVRNMEDIRDCDLPSMTDDEVWEYMTYLRWKSQSEPMEI